MCMCMFVWEGGGGWEWGRIIVNDREFHLCTSSGFPDPDKSICGSHR